MILLTHTDPSTSIRHQSYILTLSDQTLRSRDHHPDHHRISSNNLMLQATVTIPHPHFGPAPQLILQRHSNRGVMLSHSTSNETMLHGRCFQRTFCNHVIGQYGHPFFKQRMTCTDFIEKSEKIHYLSKLLYFLLYSNGSQHTLRRNPKMIKSSTFWSITFPRYKTLISSDHSFERIIPRWFK